MDIQNVGTIPGQPPVGAAQTPPPPPEAPPQPPPPEKAAPEGVGERVDVKA